MNFGAKLLICRSVLNFGTEISSPFVPTFWDCDSDVMLLFLIMTAFVSLLFSVLCNWHTSVKNHVDVAVAAVWLERFPMRISNWLTAELCCRCHPISGNGLWSILFSTMDSTPLTSIPESYIDSTPIIFQMLRMHLNFRPFLEATYLRWFTKLKPESILTPRM